MTINAAPPPPSSTPPPSAQAPQVAGAVGPAAGSARAGLLSHWLRRLVPASLFGRLLAVFIVGLVVAQGLSAWINMAERDRLMLRAAGMHPVQRVADVVDLLDPLDHAERVRLIRILAAPPQRISLDRPPMDEAAADDSGAAGGVHVTMMTAMLRSALGDDRPMRVASRSGPPLPRGNDAGPRFDDRPPPPAGMPRGPGMRPHRDHSGAAMAALVIQVQLRDGQWVTFDTLLPRAATSLPVRLLLTLAVLLAAVVALSFIAVRWLSRPLATLAQAAEALGKNIHHPPLPVDGPTELRQAATAFNTMQSRLQRTMADRTQVLAAMSHDLKTPLTRLRLRAELMDDNELRQRFEKDLAEMQAMVADSLAALRGMDGPTQTLPVDLMALLESLQADNVDMGRQVTLSGSVTAPLAGDPARLRRCIGNLIDNAVLYGQRAHIEVADSAGQVRVAIRDAGPGIAPELLERVFDPYFRLEASRNRDTGGSGLGLGIARNIARAAGGDVVLRNLRQGGLEALVTLPR